MIESPEKIFMLLKDVQPENSFWFNNGLIARNIFELQRELEQVDNKTFYYHINGVKNDISNWIRTVLRDDVLADELIKTTDRLRTAKLIQKRINKIERELEEQQNHITVETKTVSQRKLDLEKAFLELLLVFILGLAAGLAIGILLEHYQIIPRLWF
jgi:hypothetical protein